MLKAARKHYNYFRDYDPGIGRYVQSDPIGLRGGNNTFGYVEADPLGLVDPDGRTAAAAACRAFGLGRTIGNALNPFIQPHIARALDYLFLSEALSPADEKQKDWEHKDYKKRCEEKPPEGLSGCGLLLWQFNQARDCRDKRQDWDNKWMRGRHAKAIGEWGNRMANLERRIKNECCPECMRAGPYQ